MYQNFYKIQKGKHIYVMFELEKVHLGDRVKCFRTHLDLLYLLSNTDSYQLKHNRPFIVEMLYVWNNYYWFYQYIAHSCRFCTDVKISKSFMLNVFQFFIINFIFFFWLSTRHPFVIHFVHSFFFRRCLTSHFKTVIKHLKSIFKKKLKKYFMDRSLFLSRDIDKIKRFILRKWKTLSIR